MKKAPAVRRRRSAACGKRMSPNRGRLPPHWPVDEQSSGAMPASDLRMSIVGARPPIGSRACHKDEARLIAAYIAKLQKPVANAVIRLVELIV